MELILALAMLIGVALIIDLSWRHNRRVAARQPRRMEARITGEPIMHAHPIVDHETELLEKAKEPITFGDLQRLTELQRQNRKPRGRIDRD